MVFSLLYVSESQVMADVDRTIKELVDFSAAYNATVDITGSLIFTERHFAQVLEGPESEVRKLMDRIRLDARHRNVSLVFERTITRRDFEGWALAYASASSFLDKKMRRLIARRSGFDGNIKADDLYEVIVGLSG